MASLKQNTLFLYALTGSNYLFGLAIVPYLTRVLGPEVYGELGFAIAVGAYFTLIIDFGFLLSGTEKVAKNANDTVELGKIFTSISIAKIIFTFCLAIILYILALFITVFKDCLDLLFLFLFASLFSSLLPDYLYRGLEDMKMISIRGIIVRGLFTGLIFIFLRQKSQVYFVPLFQLLGNLIAGVWVYRDITKRYGIKVSKITVVHLTSTITNSCNFFFSRIASSIYNIANTVILGLLYPGSAQLGYYTSAEKLKNVAAQGCSPIADSFYPYMIRTKNYKNLFRVLTWLEIPIILLCIVCYLFASELCTLIFGNQYVDASVILQWMLPSMALILPTYMLGFPALSPIGKTKWANISVEIGTVNQILGLITLFIFNSISAVSLCVVTLISEFIVFLVRLVIVIQFFKQSK